MSATSLDRTRSAPLGSQEMITRSAPLAQRGLTLLNELSLPQRRRAPSTIQPRNARHVRQVTALGKGRITDLSISQDGQLLAVATSVGIYLLHADSLLASDILETDAPVHGLAFASDGLSLAAACGDGAVRVAAVTGTDRGTVLLTPSPVAYYSTASSTEWVSFLGGDETLLALSANGKLESWAAHDLESDQEYEVEPPQTLVEEQGKLQAAAMNQNEDVLAAVVSQTGGRNTAVYLWQLSGVGRTAPFLRPPVELPSLSGRVTNVAFSAQPGLLATGSDNGHVSLWQIRRQSNGSVQTDRIDTLKGRQGGVSCLIFSPDGRTVVSGTTQGYIQVWSVRDGALLTHMLAHTGAVRLLQYSTDGHTLYSAGEDEYLQAWPAVNYGVEDTTAVEPKASLAFTPPLSCLTWLGDRDDLAAGATEGSLLLWTGIDSISEDTAPTGSLQEAQLQAHDGALVSIACSTDGTLLATGSLDTSVQLWQVQRPGVPAAESPSLLASLSEHGAAVRAVAFAPDGLHFAVGTQTGAVWVWSLPDEEDNWSPVPTLLIEGASVLWGLAFAPDWANLAAACYDNRVLVWRLHPEPDAGYAGDQSPLTLHQHTAAVQSVSFAPDGSVLASAAHDNTARLWHLGDGGDETANPLEDTSIVLRGHTGSVTAVAFSPQGKVVATGSTDTTVRLWNTTDGALVRTLKGHTAAVTGVSFSTNGTLLASASSDGTIRLWGLSP